MSMWKLIEQLPPPHVSAALIALVGTGIFLFFYALYAKYKKIENYNKLSLLLYFLLSLAASFCAWHLSAGFTPRAKETIQVTALHQKNKESKESSIYIKKFYVDTGSFQPDSDNANGWFWQGNWYKWLGKGKIPKDKIFATSLQIPVGTKREVIFFTNQYKGLAKVKFGSWEKTVDCFSKKDGDKIVEIPDSAPNLLLRLKYKILLIYSFISFCLNICLLCYFIRERNLWNVDSNRIASLEFYRFVFCLIVILHHFQGYGHGTEAKGGYLAVDFFFILSGFFLLKYYYSQVDKEGTDEKKSLQYLWHRVKVLFPHHLFSWLCCVPIFIFITNKSFSIFLKQGIGELFFLRGTGVGVDTSVNGVNWYLSVLVVFSYFILYLIQKNKNIFIYGIAPFCFLSVMGILYNKYGHLNVYNFMSPILTWGCWRGVAELCLGCIIYEIFIHIKSYSFWINRKIIRIATILEIFILSVSIYQMLNGKNKGDYMIPYLISILLLSSFLCKSYLSRLLNNRLSIFLGKLSYPVYLNQRIGTYILPYFIPKGPFMGTTILMIFGIILFSIFSNWFVAKSSYYFARGFKKFISSN